MAFTHLHVHTEYSLLDGFAPIEELVQKAKNLDMDSLAITDHGSMFGIVKFYKTCKKYGIKPILGCEIYVSKGNYQDKNPDNKFYNHLILLAENYEGYLNLMKIVTEGYIHGFYYKPRVDKTILRKYSAGIICLSACMKGEVQEKMLHFGYEEAKKSAKEFLDIYGPDHFYLEIQNHGMREDKELLAELPKLSKELGIGLVATNDVHYIDREDYKIHNILICLQTGKTIHEENQMHYAPGEFFLRDENEMKELFPGLEEALENTALIAKRCNVDIEFGNLHLPYFKIPEGYTNHRYLEKLVFEGLHARYGKPLSEEVIERAYFEMNTIQKMGYVDYFLIVWDFIRFAKSKDIPVGPGRGSAAGSIISYALGITDIDPLEFDLLFERFLNPERVSMPDIDIDFCYERREEVIDYVIDKYGESNVAQIATFGTMAARNAIRDVGRVLDLDFKLVDETAKEIPMMLGITIDKALEINKDLKNNFESNQDVKKLVTIARRVEGMPRHTSTHAAGVVISKKPIVEYVPLALNRDAIITQFNMTELEELGLLKMDFLGLRTLTVIDDTKKLILENRKIQITDEMMDIHDEKVLHMFTVAETLGIFQFESAGMRNFLRELKPTHFDDLIAANALFRPGPMNEIPKYIQNKYHAETLTYLSPELEPILKTTYGTIVYQEQVMQIVQKIGGFSLGQADNLRRAMSKKKMDVMEAGRIKFIHGEVDKEGHIIIEGAIRRGINEDAANKIYDLMIDFAKYAFNKSHSAAYALVAMRTAWLKHYYPVEFMAALMSSVVGNTSQVALYIDECRRLKINILSPDVNYSFKKFNVEHNEIRFGLLAVKNVGYNLIDAIIASRKVNGRFENFRDFVEKVVSVDPNCINKRAIESLIKAGAFTSLGESRRSLMLHFPSVIDSVQNSLRKNIPGQSTFFDMIDQDASSVKEEYTQKPSLEYDKRELLRLEKEVLGVYLSDHPLRPYAQIIKSHANFSTIQLKDEEGIVENQYDKKRVTIIGIVEGVNKKFTKNQKLMEFVKFEDMYGFIEIIVFPKLYDRYKDMIQEDRVLVMKGRLSIIEGEDAKLILDKCIDIEDIEKKLFLQILSDTPSQIYEQIKKICLKYPGEVPVNVFIKSLNKNYRLKDDYNINLNDQSIYHLKQLVGEENLVLK